MGDMTQKVILLVDDSPMILKLLTSILKDEYRIKIATSGTKALEIMNNGAPDVVVLDVMMPEMDGFEVCASMKSSPVLRQVPVIFLSGKSDVAEMQRASQLGAEDYITKPVDAQALLESIRQAL